MAVSFTRFLIDSLNTEDVSALRLLRGHGFGRCASITAGLVFTREEQRRGPRPTLKDETQTSLSEATQPPVSAADMQELAENEKHLSDANVRETPDADWNASWFIMIHVKPVYSGFKSSFLQEVNPSG